MFGRCVECLEAEHRAELAEVTAKDKAEIARLQATVEQLQQRLDEPRELLKSAEKMVLDLAHTYAKWQPPKPPEPPTGYYFMSSGGSYSMEPGKKPEKF